MHVLFGGTKLLQSTGDKGAKIKTPDGGCLAVVLRTGFGTAQGEHLLPAGCPAAVHIARVPLFVLPSPVLPFVPQAA